MMQKGDFYYFIIILLFYYFHFYFIYYFIYKRFFFFHIKELGSTHDSVAFSFLKSYVLNLKKNLIVIICRSCDGNEKFKWTYRPYICEFIQKMLINNMYYEIQQMN
jgi:hypothetical protein